MTITNLKNILIFDYTYSVTNTSYFIIVIICIRQLIIAFKLQQQEIEKLKKELSIKDQEIKKLKEKC